MRALILSAGLGERLRPLTLQRAKPAVEFLNIPMLAFPYHWLDTLKLKDLVFNTHHLPDSVRHAVMHVVEPSQPIFFSHEKTILGSGGGIWAARPFLDGEDHFWVANADGVILLPHDDILKDMLAFHIKKQALATLLVCPLEGVGTRIPGIWLDSTGEISAFGKTPRAQYSECLHYASVMILSKRIWKYLPEGSSNIFYDVIDPLLVNDERAYGFRVDDMAWFETGNVADYLSSTSRCLDLLNSKGPLSLALEKILARYAGAFSISGSLGAMQMVAESSHISSSAQIKGFSVIGHNCVVGKNCEVRNSVLLPGSALADQQNLNQDILI